MKKSLSITILALTLMSSGYADYQVTDKDAYIYANTSVNEFDYTPEQREQINAALNNASTALKNLENTNTFPTKSAESTDENFNTTKTEQYTPQIQYQVTDKDAYIYANTSVNEFDYTPEQREQIKAALHSANTSLKYFDQSSLSFEERYALESKKCVERVLAKDLTQKKEKVIVYEDVKPSAMAAEPFATYSRSTDVLDYTKNAEPELDVTAAFVSSSMAEKAYDSQKKLKKIRKDYQTEVTNEAHDGKSWRKLLRSTEDDYTPNPNINKGLSRALKESERLRGELKNILGDKNIDEVIASAKKAEARGDRFILEENKALDSNMLSYPKNTLYLTYSPKNTYTVKVATDKETDIRLQEDEVVSAVTVGNRDGLDIDGYRGENGLHPHITIKPYETGIKTKLRITTNLSVYYFNLISGDETNYNPYVLFNLSNTNRSHITAIDRDEVSVGKDYKQSKTDNANNAILKRSKKEKKHIEVTDPEDLNFDYSIKGKKYNPQYVWDDGRYTYLLLPKKAYKHEIYLLGLLDEKVQQIREFEIQDDFMKLYGTWSEIRMRIDNTNIEVKNNYFVP